MTNAAWFPKQKPTSRAPKLTLDEIADKLGVSVSTLRGACNKDPAFPKHCLQFTGANKNICRTYFEYAAVKAWWIARNAK